jgi:hypothetical protein
MRILIRGWGRDHGETEVVDAPISDLTEVDRYSWDTAYLHEVKIYRGLRFRVSTGAKLNCSGRYLLHVELRKSEIEELYCQTHGVMDIARLFYKRFGHKEMSDIVRLLVSVKDEAEERTRKDAMYQSAIKNLIDKSEGGTGDVDK